MLLVSSIIKGGAALVLFPVYATTHSALAAVRWVNAAGLFPRSSSFVAEYLRRACDGLDDVMVNLLS